MITLILSDQLQRTTLNVTRYILPNIVSKPPPPKKNGHQQRVRKPNLDSVNKTIARSLEYSEIIAILWVIDDAVQTVHGGEGKSCSVVGYSKFRTPVIKDSSTVRLPTSQITSITIVSWWHCSRSSALPPTRPSQRRVIILSLTTHVGLGKMDRLTDTLEASFLDNTKSDEDRLRSYLASVPYTCEPNEIMQDKLQLILSRMVICARTRDWRAVSTWGGILQW